MDTNSRQDSFVAYPFYIFISLLLGAIASVGVWNLWTAGLAGSAFFYAFLAILQIVYYLDQALPNLIRSILILQTLGIPFDLIFFEQMLNEEKIFEKNF